MELRKLGNSGLYVSELILGTMTLPIDDDRESTSILERYLAAGGNTLDTADVYNRGGSEELVGRILEGRRHQVALATKVRGVMGEGSFERGLSRRHIMEALEASLRRLKTDYVDLYQIHYWDEYTPVEETMSALAACVASGKVRYIGASNVAAWQLVKALSVADSHGWPRFVSLQPNYSLMARDIEREILPACMAEGVGIIPYSPLGGGILTGKYERGKPAPAGTRGERALSGPMSSMWKERLSDRTYRIVDEIRGVSAAVGKTPSQVALRWLLDRPGVTAPLLGPKTVAHLDDNLGAIGWQLGAEHRARLDEVSAIEPGYPYNFIASMNRASAPTGNRPVA